MTEGPYTIAEVAEILRISYASARRRFMGERGVLNTGTGSKAHLRIPATVLDRVRNEMKDGVPMDRVAAILGNTEKICREHYAPWVRERQEQLEEDVRRTFRKKVVPMRKKAG